MGPARGNVFFGEVRRAEAADSEPRAYFHGRFGRLAPPEADLGELYTAATHADPGLGGDRRVVEAYERADVEAARRAVHEYAERATRSQRAAIVAAEGDR